MPRFNHMAELWIFVVSDCLKKLIFPNFGFQIQINVGQFEAKLAIFGHLFKRYFLIMEKSHFTILLKLRYRSLTYYPTNCGPYATQFCQSISR